jgi:hypothetical protein
MRDGLWRARRTNLAGDSRSRPRSIYERSATTSRRLV